MRKTFIAIATCIALGACSEKNEGPLYSGEGGFAFGAPVLNIEAVPEDGNEILVPIYRSDLKVNIADVSFEYDTAESIASDPAWEKNDPSGIFSLTTKRVIFPDGAYSAYARIRYTDITDLDPMGKYRIRLTIKGNLTPSGRDEIVITAGRKLTFELLGKCLYHDTCLFDNAYEADIYKAKEGDIYRVMDPYTAGLIAEEYADAGLMQSPPEYVQFICNKDGSIKFDPFKTGMIVPTGNGKYCMAYAYYPGEYQWGKDFSNFNKENKKISDTEFQLFPVYCLPDYQYGFLNEGAYVLTITMK